MAVLKAKALPLMAAALLLCGCAGRPLSEREMIRALFLEQEGPQYTACLLLEDKNAPEGEQGYKTAAAWGKTPAQALERAEGKLDGVAYYGLMDVAALPHAADWALAAEIGELLYEKTQPSPEIALFALDGLPASRLEEEAAALYEGMQGAERAYGLHCGLQQLFVREGACVLPVWKQTGYDCLILSDGEEPLRLEEADAQLAAVLCGQSDRFDFAFAGENAAFRAKARVTVEAQKDRTAVCLHLTDSAFSMLTPALEEAQARTLLYGQWRAAFGKLCQEGSDVMRLDFWASCRYGPGTKAAAPSLQILFE